MFNSKCLDYEARRISPEHQGLLSIRLKFAAIFLPHLSIGTARAFPVELANGETERQLTGRPSKLVLSRKIGETTVSESIGLKNGGVRLGIEAPASVRVDRSEVHELGSQWQTPSEQTGSRMNTKKRTQSLNPRMT